MTYIDSSHTESDQPPNDEEAIEYDISKTEKFHLMGYMLYGLSPIVITALQIPQWRMGGYISLALLAIAGIPLINQKYRSSGLKTITGIYIVFLGIYGYLSKNWTSFWAADCAFFGTFIGVWSGSNPNFLKKLVRAYSKVLIVAVVVTGPLMFFQLTPSSLGERVVSESFNFSNTSTFIPSAFLLFFSEMLSQTGRYITYSGLGLWLLFGFLTASRGALLLPISAMILRYIVIPKEKRISQAGKIISISFLILISSLLVWSSTSLEESFENTQSRFQVSGEDFSSGRSEEASDFIESLTPLEIFFGRGLGGSNYYDEETYGETRAHGLIMVHYGHLHLVLKGGFILLILIGTLFLKSLSRSFRSNNFLPRACAATLLLFALANITHTQFLDSPMLPFFWVALGYGLSHNEDQEENDLTDIEQEPDHLSNAK